MYSYAELIAVCNRILTELQNLNAFLHTYILDILYILSFFVLMYFGFKCLRGYRV